MDKRDKIKKIILDDCGGSWGGLEVLLEQIVDNIYEKLKDISDDYNELLSAYIRL